MRIRPLGTLSRRLGLRLRFKISELQKSRQTKVFSRMQRASGVKLTTRQERSTYATVMIHPYAGIGHQMSGWIAAELWSKDLGLILRGVSIPRDESGMFNLGDSGALPPVSTKRVRLRATMDERTETSLPLLKALVERAQGRAGGREVQVEFALDQPRWDQSPSSEIVRTALLKGIRGADLVKMEGGDPYVAVHVRRSAFPGDISEEASGHRWVSIDWYLRLITKLAALPSLAGTPIRVYALGDPAEFDPLLQISGLELRMNGERDQDFVELAAAAVLVAAPSSFSFTAALASKGVVLARHPWWHNVPDFGRWVRVTSDADFDKRDFGRAWTSRSS